MRKQHLLALAAVCAAALLAPAPASAAGPAAAPRPATASDGSADFNGDGYPDLAISALTTTVGGVEHAGALAVRYGSADGLSDKAALISQDTPGVPGEPKNGDRFGRILGQGDLDHDGYADLLIRSNWPGPAAIILRGGKQGLSGRGVVAIDRAAVDSGALPLSPTVMGLGDVTGDGVTDIVTATFDGALKRRLTVLQGPFDFSRQRPAAVHHRQVEVLDGIHPYRVYVGDMTGDGIADVVTGTHTEGVTGAVGKGMVYKGGPAGLTPAGSAAAGTSGDFGDVDKDGYQDFVTGAPGGKWTPDGGWIHVTYGGPGGARTPSAIRAYTQNSPGVPGAGEPEDYWGAAVTVGDTDGDGYADVVVGAPRETGTDTEATFRSGAITVLRGGPAGITAVGAKAFTQNSASIPSTSERFDNFGASVTLIDTDKDAKPELYVGGYGEDSYTGRVWKLKTDATGLTGTGATSFNLADLGGPGGRAHFGIGFGHDPGFGYNM
ncbi:FG-GAP repeat protein [Streptomyces sp. NPDC002104]